MSRIPVSSRFGKHMCHGGCDQMQETQDYSRKLTQILHVSVHGIPGSPFLRQARLLLLTVALYLWYMFYSPPVQLRSILAASAYTFIEYSFTYFSDGKPFTSFGQFWGNLLYTPVLLDVYWDCIVGKGKEITTAAGFIYVILFPFNVWMLEIVLDQWFLLVYNRNVAWCYCTYSDSHVRGVVRVGHGIYWLIMGFVLLQIYPLLRDMTNSFQWSQMLP